MNGKKIEEMQKVLELIKANQNFDIAVFEAVVKDLESIIGKELDRADETKMENELAENIQKTLLKALDGNPSLDMISIVEQIVSQSGNEYRAIKTRYMNDAVSFFIDYLGIEDTTKRATDVKRYLKPEKVNEDEDEQS